MTERTAARVFISYTHDSAEHKELVLAFGTFLRAKGIDAELDRWSTDRRRDWYAWMLDLATRADFVVVVASPGYRRAGDGDVRADEHRGTQSEASLLRELLHSDRETWIPKLLPVVLPGGDVGDIPLFLQPRTADHYPVEAFTDTGAADLLRVLTAQPAHPRPPLGTAPVLPPAAEPGSGSVHQTGGGVQAANTGTVGGDFIVGGSGS